MDEVDAVIDGEGEARKSHFEAIFPKTMDLREDAANKLPGAGSRSPLLLHLGAGSRSPLLLHLGRQLRRAVNACTAAPTQDLGAVNELRSLYYRV